MINRKQVLALVHKKRHRRGGGVFLFIFLSSLLCAVATFAGPEASRAQVLIAGAGPGGLTAALELLAAGMKPEDILLLEKRGLSESTDLDTGRKEPSHPYASRRRVIALDKKTVEQLIRLGVEIPGGAAAEFNFHFGKREYRLPLSGLAGSGVSVLLGRDFRQMVDIGELEKALLRAYKSKGGRVLFGQQASIEHTADGVRVLRNDGEPIDAEYAVIAEGARSETREKLGVRYEPVHPHEASPVYFVADYRFNANHIRREGGGDMLFDKNGGLVGYSFFHRTAGSIAMLISQEDLKRPNGNGGPVEFRDSAAREKYISRLSNAASEFGLHTDQLGQSSIFEARLRQSDRVFQDRVIVMGDAARSTDPISASGANTAMDDARAVGDFFRQIKVESQNPKTAADKLVRQVRENTRRCFESALYFRDLFGFMAKNPRLSHGLIKVLVPEADSREGYGALKRRIMGLVTDVEPLSKDTQVKVLDWRRKFDRFLPPPPVPGTALRTKAIPIHPIAADCSARRVIGEVLRGS